MRASRRRKSSRSPASSCASTWTSSKPAFRPPRPATGRRSTASPRRPRAWPWLRWRAAEMATRSEPSKRSASLNGRTFTSSSRPPTSTSSTSCAPPARRRWRQPCNGSPTGGRRSARMPRSNSAPRMPRAPTRSSCCESTRRSSMPVPPRSTSPTPSAMPSPPNSGRSWPRSSTAWAAAPSSASTATTTSAWPRPTRWPPSRPVLDRSR